jgi:hypothetical protein
MVSNITPINNASKDIVEYVPFGGENVVLGDEVLEPDCKVSLQYATGLNAHRPKLDKEGYQVYDEDGKPEIDEFKYKGFFVQVGKDKELDAVMQARGVPRLFITHGKGDVVEHWEVSKPTVFLIAKGIPSNPNSNGEYGIAYVRTDNIGHTEVRAQVIIRQLLPEYTKPLVISFKSTQSRDCLNAIRKQYKVLAHVRQLLQKTGREMALPLWSYSMTLGPSKVTDKRGQGTDVAIIYPVASGVPDEITPAYLKNHEVLLEFADPFNELTLNTVEWARELTQRLAVSDDPQEPRQNSNGNADDKKLNETPF